MTNIPPIGGAAGHITPLKRTSSLSHSNSLSPQQQQQPTTPAGTTADSRRRPSAFGGHSSDVEELLFLDKKGQAQYSDVTEPGLSKMAASREGAGGGPNDGLGLRRAFDDPPERFYDKSSVNTGGGGRAVGLDQVASPPLNPIPNTNPSTSPTPSSPPTYPNSATSSPKKPSPTPIPTPTFIHSTSTSNNSNPLAPLSQSHSQSPPAPTPSTSTIRSPPPIATSTVRPSASSASLHPNPSSSSNTPSPRPTPNPPSQQPIPSPSPNPRLPLLPSAVVSPAPPTGLYWSKTPQSATRSFPRGMRAHSATLIESGGGGGHSGEGAGGGAGAEVWVFGGCDLGGRCGREVWKFDVDSFIWTKPKVIGELPPVTRAHTAVAVDYRIFIIGGGDGPTYYNETWIFDTLSLTWSKPTIRGTPPSRRRAHTCLLYDQKILLFGGGNGSHALNDFWTLDCGDIEGGGLEWRKVETRYSGRGKRGGNGSGPIARGYHTMSLVGSKVVVFGGSDGTECFSDVWVLDLESLVWTEINLDPIESGSPNSSSPSPITFPRLSHTTTVVGSYLFVIGGHDGVNFSNDIILFNLVTLQWEPRKAYGIPPSPRGYHTTIIHDSRILVIGGFNGQNVFDEVWTLDLAGSSFLPQITNFEVVVDEEEDDEGEEGRRLGNGRMG